MKNLLYKEFSLCMPLQVPLFLCFAFMIMIPSYPYLVAGFFICNAIFYSFMTAAMENDVTFSLLLPVSKAQIVRAKMLFVQIIQCVSLVLFSGVAVLNFFAHKNAGNNAGTTSSLTLIGAFLLLYCVFNLAFIPRYYKAPHKAGRIFLLSAVSVFVFIAIFEGFMIATEALHETVPFFAFIKTYIDTFPTTAAAWAYQGAFFAVCVLVYIAANEFCYKRAKAEFEMAEI